MKSKRFVLEKIEAILTKRYALDKILTFKKLSLVLLLSLCSFFLSFLFWICVALYKEQGDINGFWVSMVNVILLAIVLGLGYGIWKIIGNFIPRFVLIGLLGWFLIGAGLISNILVPGTIVITESNTDDRSIQLPAGRYTSMNEKEANEISDFSSSDFFSNTFENVSNILLAPSVFKVESKKTKGNDSPGFFKSKVLKPIRLIIFGFFLLILLDLFFTVTMFGKPGNNYHFHYFYLSWKKRERCVVIKTIAALSLAIILFFITMNYFFVLLVLLVSINVFLIRWEIRQRGQNHKLYARTVLFLFLIYFFSLTAGEAFFLVYLPIFIFIKEGSQILSLYDAVLINWIILVGSLASILIGITTQVVWSGQRLTEKFK